MDAIGAVVVRAGHRADVDLRPDGVTVRLFSGDLEGLSTRDVEVAAAISAEAARLGAPADPRGVQHVQIAIDAMDIAAVRPFWRTVLGYPEVGDADVMDAQRRGPTVWFQQMHEPRPGRNRFHVDVYLAPDEVQGRIAAALAAGGRVVSDQNAPEWWTLADPEGNEVDLAIWMSE
ncbi:MAG: 4a-hydroxytetrahydrobiopterin dehydratase [Acidobacteriota bacterium]|nr:4a-hydroxytetrahydrobiopterin dehydratase [Acidobacteriota bacterium]